MNDMRCEELFGIIYGRKYYDGEFYDNIYNIFSKEYNNKDDMAKDIHDIVTKHHGDVKNYDIDAHLGGRYYMFARTELTTCKYRYYFDFEYSLTKYVIFYYGNDYNNSRLYSVEDAIATKYYKDGWYVIALTDDLLFLARVNDNVKFVKNDDKLVKIVTNDDIEFTMSGNEFWELGSYCFRNNIRLTKDIFYILML